MTKIQTYLFFEVLRAVVIIIGGLAMLALLAQGLSRTDVILENRQSALTYFPSNGLDPTSGSSKRCQTSLTQTASSS